MCFLEPRCCPATPTLGFSRLLPPSLFLPKRASAHWHEHRLLMGRLTESQNGRGWKGPLWVIQSNPLPKQGHPEQAAQHRVQVGLEYLQRRRLHNLPGQPGPGLHHLQREEVLPRSDGTSCASVCAHCPFSCHWAPLKRVWTHPPDTHSSDIDKHL